MKLKDVLKTISSVAKENSISEPFLCGGTVRDKVVGNTKNSFSDIDITTGTALVKNLAIESAILLKKQYNIKTKTAKDGHSSIFLGELKIDFSSNYISPHIDSELKRLGIEAPTDLEKEMFSRDFTANALLMTMDLKTIKDPTKLGVKDIRQKVLKTCLAPEITLSDNTDRIIRVIYLAAKLGFKVDPEIVKFITENKQLISKSTEGFLIKNLDKAMDANPEITISLINEMNLWDVLPSTEKTAEHRPKNKIAMQVTARKQDDLATLKSNIGNYIHFSDSDRFGISFHKNVHPGNPRGLYGFPLTNKEYLKIEAKNLYAFEEYGESKYIYIFNVSGNILNLESFDLESVSKAVLNFVLANYSNKLDEHNTWYLRAMLSPDAYRGSKGQKFFAYIRQIGSVLTSNKILNNEHSSINIILRGIGYDAIESNNNGFDDGIKSEICILTPKSVNLIAKINNPMLAKEVPSEFDKKAQLRQNYDYGEGLYMNLDKYKSVSDFRKKRMKKRKKEIKKIKDMKKLAYHDNTEQEIPQEDFFSPIVNTDAEEDLENRENKSPDGKELSLEEDEVPKNVLQPINPSPYGTPNGIEGLETAIMDHYTGSVEDHNETYVTNPYNDIYAHERSLRMKLRADFLHNLI